MRRSWLLQGLLLMCSASFVPSAFADEKKASPTDQQIRKILIEASIAAYSGNCPCPYSRAKNGSRCGKRSAWSRAGGEQPLCYSKDVSAQMVQEYRDARAENRH